METAREVQQTGKRFKVSFTNEPWRNRSFSVRGICQFDVLNPCWDDSPNDIIGQHWGGPEFKACDACTKAALAHAAQVQS